MPLLLVWCARPCPSWCGSRVLCVCPPPPCPTGVGHPRSTTPRAYRTDGRHAPGHLLQAEVVLVAAIVLLKAPGPRGLGDRPNGPAGGSAGPRGQGTHGGPCDGPEAHGGPAGGTPMPLGHTPCPKHHPPTGRPPPKCPGTRCTDTTRAVLNGEKKRKEKVFRNQSSQKSPQALYVLNHGWWRLAVGGWRLVAVGGWRLAVGGPLGRSLRAVLNKKKKSGPLRTALDTTRGGARPLQSGARPLRSYDALRRSRTALQRRHAVAELSTTTAERCIALSAALISAPAPLLPTQPCGSPPGTYFSATVSTFEGFLLDSRSVLLSYEISYVPSCGSRPATTPVHHWPFSCSRVRGQEVAVPGGDWGAAGQGRGGPARCGSGLAVGPAWGCLGGRGCVWQRLCGRGWGGGGCRTCALFRRDSPMPPVHRKAPRLISMPLFGTA